MNGQRLNYLEGYPQPFVGSGRHRSHTTWINRWNRDKAQLL